MGFRMEEPASMGSSQSFDFTSGCDGVLLDDDDDDEDQEYNNLLRKLIDALGSDDLYEFLAPNIIFKIGFFDFIISTLLSIATVSCFFIPLLTTKMAPTFSQTPPSSYVYTTVTFGPAFGPAFSKETLFILPVPANIINYHFR